MSIKYYYKDEIHKAYELPKDLSVLLKSLPVLFVNKLPYDFTLQYNDNDGDRVTITTDNEYQALVNHEIKTLKSSLKVWIVPIDENVNPNHKNGNIVPKSPSGNGSFEVVDDAESPKRPEIIEFGSSESQMMTPNDSLNQSNNEYVYEGFESPEKKESETDTRIVVSLIIPPSEKAGSEKSISDDEEAERDRLENTPDMSRRNAVQEMSLSLDSKEAKEEENNDKSDYKSDEYGSFAMEDRKVDVGTIGEELSFTSGGKRESEGSMRDCLSVEKKVEDDSFDENYKDSFGYRQENNRYNEEEDSFDEKYRQSFDSNDESEEPPERKANESHHYDDHEEKRLEVYLPESERGQEQGQEKWVSFSSDKNDHTYGSFGVQDNKEVEIPVWLSLRPDTPDMCSPKIDVNRFAGKDIIEKCRDETENSRENIEEDLVKNLDELEKMFEGLREEEIDDWSENNRKRMQELDELEVERANKERESELRWANDNVFGMEIEKGMNYYQDKEESQNEIELKELEISLLELSEAKKMASAIGSFRQPETIRRKWVKSPEKKKVASPMYNRWVSKYREVEVNLSDQSHEKEQEQKQEEYRDMYEMRECAIDHNESQEKEVEKKQEGEEAWPFLRQSKLWRRREAWNFGLKSEENSEKGQEKDDTQHGHEGSFCMRCWATPICGPRYVCLLCKGVEYCDGCEKSAEHEHPLLKLRQWVDSEFIIQNLREKVKYYSNEKEEEEDDEVSYKELHDQEDETPSQELEHHPLSLWGRASQNFSHGEASLQSSSHLPLDTRTTDMASQTYCYERVRDQLQGYGQRQDSEELELELEPDYRFDYKEISSSPVSIRSNKKEWCLVYKTVCLRNCGKSAWRRCCLEPVGIVPGTSTEVAYVGAGDSVLVTLEIHGFFDARRHTSTWKITHNDDDGNCVTMGYIVLEFDILESGMERYRREEDDMGRQVERREIGRKIFGGFRDEEFEWFNEA